MESNSYKRLISFTLVILLMFSIGCSNQDDKKKAFIKKGNQLFDENDSKSC
jgi:uncharacterized lipoprotein NlpE involved in copper resistance